MLVFPTAADPHGDAAFPAGVTASFCVVGDQLLMLGGRHVTIRLVCLLESKIHTMRKGVTGYLRGQGEEYKGNVGIHRILGHTMWF